MSKRYAENIRRIVGIDLNQSNLPDQKAAQQIVGNRGIAYYLASPTATNTPGNNNQNVGTVSGSSGNTATANNTTLESAGKITLTGGVWQPIGINGTSQSQNQNTIADNSQSGPLGGSGGSGTPQGKTIGTNSVAAGAIIDGTADQAKVPAQNNPASQNISGAIYYNSPALEEITAEDCTTGDDLSIGLVRNKPFAPPQAVLGTDGSVLYPAWDDADTPPEKTWAASVGHYFEVNQIFGTGGTKYGMAASDFVDYCIADGNACTNPFYLVPPVSISYITSSTIVVIDTRAVQFTYSFADNVGNINLLDPTKIISNSRTATEWPLDGKYIFRINDAGQYVTSQYDSEVPTIYSSNTVRSNINFCFSGGTRHGTIEQTVNGGHMIYETVAGAPTGIVRAYDSSGAMVAAFDAGSDIITSYRPS